MVQRFPFLKPHGQRCPCPRCQHGDTSEAGFILPLSVFLRSAMGAALLAGVPLAAEESNDRSQLQSWANELSDPRATVRDRATRRFLALKDIRSVPMLKAAALSRELETASRAVMILKAFAIGEDFELSESAYAAVRTAAKRAGHKFLAQRVLNDYSRLYSASIQELIEGKGGSFDLDRGGRITVALNGNWTGGASILKRLNRLQKMKALSLERSGLADDDLKPLRGQSVEMLLLGDTPITSAGLAAIGEMPHVHHLSLRRLRLGAIPDDLFRSFAQLETLILAESDVTDRDVRALRHLPNLSRLNLDGTAVGDAGVASLSEIATLTELDLRSTQIKGETLDVLGKTRVTKLWLKGTTLSESAFKKIAKLEQLQTLGLDHTNVENKDLQSLRGLAELRELWLSKTAVTNEGIALLSSLPKLEVVYVHGANVTNVAKLKLQERLPNARVEGTR